MAYASHRYLTSLDDSRAHVRYIGFREREDRSESLGLFSEHEDSADAEKFIESLKTKNLSHSEVPNVHTVLFSMSGDEWKRSGFQPGDYQKMIRRIMKDWEVRHGYRLDWVAAEHRNPDHPHCHVVIRGAYRDKDGHDRRLYVTNEDRRYFREHFQKVKEIERPVDPPPKEVTHQIEKSHSMNISSKFIENLLHQADRELEQQEYERDQARRRAQNRNRGRSR